jgi:DNA-directed RNA polymerase specialized sigma24 family protein
MAMSGITWTVTPEAFDSLLLSFDSDREHAGRVYENLRRKLLEFFEARGSCTPEDHADETFDRVMRRIAHGEKIENASSYCYGVARFVWMEASRNRAKEPVPLDEDLLPKALAGVEPQLEASRESIERQLDCLEMCLSRLADETRQFIFDYYGEENGIKIEQRKLLAARLNTTLNALRLRASRLRRELARCTQTCVARSVESGGEE